MAQSPKVDSIPEVIIYYLDSDCGLSRYLDGTPSNPLPRLLQFYSQNQQSAMMVKMTLLNTLRREPGPELIEFIKGQQGSAELRSIFETDLELIKQSYDRKGNTKSQTRDPSRKPRFRFLTTDEFVKLRLTDLARRYQERAATALAAIASVDPDARSEIVSFLQETLVSARRTDNLSLERAILRALRHYRLQRECK